MKNSISTFSKLLASFILFGVCFLYFLTSYDSHYTFRKLLISGQGYSFYDYTTITLIFSLYLIIISTWIHTCLDVNIGFMCVKYTTRQKWIRNILKFMGIKYATVFSLYIIIIIFFEVYFSGDIMLLVNLNYLISCIYLCIVMYLITKAQLLIAIKYSTLHSVVNSFVTFVIGLLVIKSKYFGIHFQFNIVSNDISNFLLIFVILICANKILNKLIFNLGDKKEFI